MVLVTRRRLLHRLLSHTTPLGTHPTHLCLPMADHLQVKLRLAVMVVLTLLQLIQQALMQTVLHRTKRLENSLANLCQIGWYDPFF
jgi:hypothetical protein